MRDARLISDHSSIEVGKRRTETLLCDGRRPVDVQVRVILQDEVDLLALLSTSSRDGLQGSDLEENDTVSGQRGIC